MTKRIFILVLSLFIYTVIYAQVPDSFYNLSCKYYNTNEKELAKKCLLTFINRQMTHQDSTEMNSILGYAYYMNLSYDLLKMIFFEEKDYENALVYNEKQFKFLRSGGLADGLDALIIGMTRDSFSAECYYAMKDYKNAMELSTRIAVNERMLIIFINSASYTFGKESLKEEFMEEFEKISTSEWRVVYDSNDTKHIKKKIYRPGSTVIFNIFGYELHIHLLEEMRKIESDLIDNKITLEIANNRIRDEIKKKPIYKLIMEN